MPILTLYMTSRVLFLVILLLLMGTYAMGQPGQRQVTQQQLIWYSYNNTLLLHSNWSFGTELHERRFFNPDKHHQFLVRNSIRRKVGEGWEASAGFTYFLQSPNEPDALVRLTIPELRPHLQLNYNQPLGNLTIAHRYRAEKRYFRNASDDRLTNGYNSNYRFRYRVGIEYKLATIRNQPLKLKVNNEVFVNAGKRILYNRFDQNRIYAGVNYAILDNLEFEAAYQHWYQQRRSGYQFYNRHIINLAIYHRIDLSKKSDKEAQ
ncbi:DUF2490 domain-containing protein [uncultured Pontibacter sp.]|uniref:DUF2490 domain-containing protein n=1 Tax=uncultured Pontibacter sp. TaxID=453356 RepID=UPI002612C789|nr:DUF2490 domain-containing protein [uncultured Pontibacter sp.]